ncbi:tyrosine-protein phosphatase [Paenibacillus sp. OV219]|uniref:tyrosine-protein phosphatase n=1 Tax=Paenibacillus sp. OV219 TaxID=1884377 RepID=UPI0008D46F04|nr:CpsB/CapC family capsule biosynthesis tyrosine phosphatase [Paenibacillus sp. OV219]SEN60934.1 protein-tyrosine phosphatase [Paenibacillus sp. OV219]
MMIDIHTHILPGIDDGAGNLEDSLALARAAVAEGITGLIATPHHADGRYMNNASFVSEQVERLKEELAARQIPLELFVGQEIRVHSDMLDVWSAKELATLAGSKYILLEMPSASVPSRMLEYIHEFVIMGINPIIAHPERNAEVVKYPDKLNEMIEAGAYGQMTTHSLLGGFGKQIERRAWQLCREGLIHVISSDAHHMERRGFRLREAYDRVSKELGVEIVKTYLDNSESVISNRDLIEPSVKSNKSRGNSWFKLPNFFHNIDR